MPGEHETEMLRELETLRREKRELQDLVKGRIRAVELKAGDMLFFLVDELAGDDVIARFREAMQAELPGMKAFIVNNARDIVAVRPAQGHAVV